LAFYFHILTTIHGQNHIKKKVWCVACPDHVQPIPRQLCINIVLRLLYDLKMAAEFMDQPRSPTSDCLHVRKQRTTGEQGRNMQLLTPKFILREDAHHFEIPHRKNWHSNFLHIKFSTNIYN
jgi:hypothetical protein